jgi:hypothetical protein
MPGLAIPHDKTVWSDHMPGNLLRRQHDISYVSLCEDGETKKQIHSKGIQPLKPLPQHHITLGTHSMLNTFTDPFMPIL